MKVVARRIEAAELARGIARGRKVEREVDRVTEHRESPGRDLQPWYALRVRSHYERVVATSLNHKGYREFVPYYRAKRRWSDRTKIVEFPLFPGYVFCRFDPEKRLPILQTPGVVSVVSFGKKFIPVDEKEIESIRAIVTAGCEVRPWPYLRVGQRVRIRGGALDGVEGLLLEVKNETRLVVSISLLQRSVAAEIDRGSIEPVL